MQRLHDHTALCDELGMKMYCIYTSMKETLSNNINKGTHTLILPGSTVFRVGLSRPIDLIFVQTRTLVHCNTAIVTDVISDHS